jgi:hypothetical protein
MNQPVTGPVDARLMGKMDLFGLAGIMLRTMEESATVGVESHGGPAWKAFARALWNEAKSRNTPRLHSADVRDLPDIDYSISVGGSPLQL